jgi:hypothetical protein
MARTEAAFADDKKDLSEDYVLSALSSADNGGAYHDRSSAKDLEADLKVATTRDMADEEAIVCRRSSENDDAGTVEDGSIADRAGAEYKVYGKRWFGLVVLTFLNIIVSWDVS